MYCPDYNLISSVSDITEISGLTEPVTVQDCKDYMRLEGWAGEMSQATEFSFDDDLIAELRTSARQYIEQMANVSLIPHQFEVVLTNMGKIALPFSPIDQVISVFDTDDNNLTDKIKVVGNDMKFLKEPIGYDLVVTYTTKVLIDSRPHLDIKRLVAAMYDNRGMDLSDVVKNLNLLIFSYSRKSVIA